MKSHGILSRRYMRTRIFESGNTFKQQLRATGKNQGSEICVSKREKEFFKKDNLAL